MPKKPPNDVLKARREAAELLGFGDNPERLCASDRLKVDLVCSLRAAIDHAAQSLVDGDGGSADLGRLISATESLVKLLPARQLEPPVPRREDPREALLKMYMQMRERGQLGDRAQEPSLRERLAAVEAENAQLKAQLAALVPSGQVKALPPPSGAPLPNPPSASAPAPASPPSKPFVNGLSDVPQHVRDTRPANEPWRSFEGGGHYDRWSNRNW